MCRCATSHRLMGCGGACPSKEDVEAGDSDSLETSRDDEVTSSQPSDIVVSAPEEPGLHGLPDNDISAPRPSKNKQKPTPWGFHDVGLSVYSMVGMTGFEPATSSSRTTRATKLRHIPVLTCRTTRRQLINNSRRTRGKQHE